MSIGFVAAFRPKFFGTERAFFKLSRSLDFHREYPVQTPAANFLFVLNPSRSYRRTARSFPDVTVSDTEV